MQTDELPCPADDPLIAAWQEAGRAMVQELVKRHYGVDNYSQGFAVKMLPLFEENGEHYFGGSELNNMAGVLVIDDDGREIDIMTFPGGPVFDADEPEVFNAWMQRDSVAIRQVLTAHLFSSESSPDTMYFPAELQRQTVPRLDSTDPNSPDYNPFAE